MRKSFLFYVFLSVLLSAWVIKLSYFIGYDGVFYARVGANVFAGKGFSVNTGEAYTHKPIFYPLALGAANLLFKNPQFSGYFVSVLAFSFSVIPLFFLTRRIYSEKSAHWASFLYVTNGYLHLRANQVMTESLFTLLVLVLLYLLHRSIQPGGGGWVSGLSLGATAGMASLTRIDGALFSEAGLLAILFLSASPWRVRIKTAFAALLIFGLFLFPYLRLVHASTQRVQLGGVLSEIVIRRQLDLAHPGHYLETKKFYQGLTDDKSKIRINTLSSEFRFWDYLVKDNFALLRSIPNALILRITALNRYLFGGLGFFFIGAACLSAPWDPKRRRSELLFLLFLATFVFQLFSEFIPKRYFFYFPILLIWMGNGIEVFRNWSKETFRLSHRGSLAAALGICLFFASASAVYAHRVLTSFPPPLEYQEMGGWMKKNIPRIEQEVVAAAHPSVCFYSGARLLSEPYFPYVEKFEDFLVYMAHNQARYFVVSNDSETPILMESYLFLLDETKPLPPGILRRHTVARGNRKIILYEIQR